MSFSSFHLHNQLLLFLFFPPRISFVFSRSLCKLYHTQYIHLCKSSPRHTYTQRGFHCIWYTVSIPHYLLVPVHIQSMLLPSMVTANKNTLIAIVANETYLTLGFFAFEERRKRR